MGESVSDKKNDEPIEHLVLRVFQATAEIRKANSANAAAVRNLQETCARIAALLQNHSQALRMHQKTLDVLANELGLAFTPEEPPEQAPPPGPAN
jgi:flagellar biosynthesis/type III secretory pathway chaperone